MSKLKMIVTGSYRGRNYADVVTFYLTRPKRHGLNYTMNVELDGKPASAHYVDVPYNRHLTMDNLAQKWIKEYYGNTVKEVRTLEQEAAQ